MTVFNITNKQRISFASKSQNSQRGIALIEALISLLIIAVSIAASLHIVGRANAAKTEMSVQSIAAREMRGLLMNHDLDNASACSGGLTLAGVTFSGSGCADSDAPSDAEAVMVGNVIVKNTAGTNMNGRIVLSVENADAARPVLAGSFSVGGSLPARLDN